MSLSFDKLLTCLLPSLDGYREVKLCILHISLSTARKIIPGKQEIFSIYVVGKRRRIELLNTGMNKNDLLWYVYYYSTVELITSVYRWLYSV